VRIRLTRLRADALLVLAAFVWGTAFIAQKRANESMGPILFVGVRFALTALVVAPLAWIEARRARARLDASAVRFGCGIGVMLAAGATLQQLGMTTTSATKGGFLTSVYLVMVPFVGFVVSRTPLRVPLLVASAVSLLGAFLLAGTVDLRSWSRGDLLLLVADVAWAFQITSVSGFLARTDRPFFLAFAQSAVTGVAALALGAAVEPIDPSGIARALGPILYAGVCSGGVAFTIQVVAQRHTPAAEASLLMGLESVFAAAAGALLLGERLTPVGATGCGLILAGAIAVEAYPALSRASRATTPD
jgi:drug/metabolite transporter (DMT)-like permease